jgi:two-component system sensor histidine kinase/response regulator
VQVIADYAGLLAKTLIGDVNRIQQVLLNLLSNARKFVPKTDGIIKIESLLTKKEYTDYIEISVFDNGPGISAEDKTKLFKPFSKL